MEEDDAYVIEMASPAESDGATSGSEEYLESMSVTQLISLQNQLETDLLKQQDSHQAGDGVFNASNKCGARHSPFVQQVSYANDAQR